jgi:DNA-binding transcriptional regulator PaaX
MMKMLFRLMERRDHFVFNAKRRAELARETGPEAARLFRYLQRAGYVAQIEGDRFEMTDLARINLLSEIVHSQKPDGKLRIVIFDVPEKLKRNRNFFRRHLVELGFKMRQKSVWVSPLPCEDLVRLVVRYHGLGKFVELVVGKVGLIR